MACSKALPASMPLQQIDPIIPNINMLVPPFTYLASQHPAELTDLAISTQVRVANTYNVLPKIGLIRVSPTLIIHRSEPLPTVGDIIFTISEENQMSIAVVFAHGMHDARLDDKFAKVTLEGLRPQGRRDYYKFEALNRKYVESLHAYSRFLPHVILPVFCSLYQYFIPPPYRPPNVGQWAEMTIGGLTSVYVTLCE